jgi:hypothetical protein
VFVAGNLSALPDIFLKAANIRLGRKEYPTTNGLAFYHEPQWQKRRSYSLGTRSDIVLMFSSTVVRKSLHRFYKTFSSSTLAK